MSQIALGVILVSCLALVWGGPVLLIVHIMTEIYGFSKWTATFASFVWFVPVSIFLLKNGQKYLDWGAKVIGKPRGY